MPSDRNRRAVLTLKVVGVLAVTAVFVGVGAAWSTKTYYNSRFTEVTALDVDSGDVRSPQQQYAAKNFLVVGSDSRAGDNAVDRTPAGGARSDSVFVAHVPADRSRAVVVSFLRDLEVTRPACERWDPVAGTYSNQVVPAAAQVKLNTAYAVGGPRCITKLIQQLSGLRISHYVGMEFAGFQDMVDAIGGVTVHADGPIVDRHQGTIAEDAGPLPLDGDKALRFVRARKVAGDPTSDYGRIERQQQFMAALLGKAMTTEVLFDPARLRGFVTAFADSSVGENVNVDELITLAQSMKGTGSGQITFRTVPTTGGANARGNEVLVEDKANALFSALIDNKPLPAEE